MARKFFLASLMLVGYLGYLVYLVIPMNPNQYNKIQAQKQFGIEPLSYNVTIVDQKPVELEYTLSNNIDAKLNFQLQFAKSEIEALKGYQVGILANEEEFSMEPNTNKTIKITLTPSEDTPDFAQEINIKLTQTESEMSLTQKEHSLKINLQSKLASIDNENKTTLIIIGGFVILGVIVIIVLLILNKKYGA